jgi:amino acid adenylation domain-containing protein
MTGRAGKNQSNIEAVYPLSPMQQGMLFHTVYAPGSGMYFEQLLCKLDGELDLAIFERAWQTVLDRHPILRSAFVWEDIAEPLQLVGRRVKLQMAVEDWTDLAASAQDARLAEFLEQDRQRGFKLSKAPLMRLALLKLDQSVYQFVWSHHHLLLDGWSVSLVFQEVFAIYGALREGSEPRLPSSRPYRDYIAWLKQQSRQQAESFWRDELKGLSPSSIWGSTRTDVRATEEQDYQDVQTVVPRESTRGLQAIARSHRLTLNTLVQGAWAILMSRYSGGPDVAFGTVVAGRPAELAGVENMIGMFINTLPIRLSVSPALALISWLDRLQDKLAQIRRFEHSSLADVQKWSELGCGVPLFETLFLFENYPVDESLAQGMSNLEVREFRARDRANYPVSVFVAPGECLALRISYDKNRFRPDVMSRALRHFRTLLEVLPAHALEPIASFPMLTGQESHQLLAEHNDTQTGLTGIANVFDIIRRAAQQCSGRVGAKYGDEHISYGDLLGRSHQLAAYLQSYGVVAGTRIAICMDRSIEMLIAMLGVLGSGGCYVPIDPGYPIGRVAFMLEDAEVSIVLTLERHIDGLPASSAHIICVDGRGDGIPGYWSGQRNGRQDFSVPSNSPAYVIYTSGSTGKAKGVVVSHANLVTSTRARLDYYHEPVREFLLLSSFAFDSSVAGIYWTLCQCATLLLPEGGREYDVEYIADIFKENRVSHFLLVPALYQQFLEHLGPVVMRATVAVIVAGEECPIKLAESHAELLPATRLFNEYGPTECAVWSSVFPVFGGRSTLFDERVPIGRPVDNARAYVLDSMFAVAPMGSPGELCIGGGGVTSGYLGRPALTGERYVPDPYVSSPGATMYRTGDICRTQPDGNLQFLGRADHQVKIRGFRVELQEIERALIRHPLIAQATVVVNTRGAGTGSLVAYLVASDEGRIDAGDVKSFLEQSMPQHMIPSAFVFLAEIPRGANGKVDRSALPAPDAAGPSGAEFVEPETETERALAEVWEEVLRVGRVGVHDNFFALGGDSILSLQLLSRARERGLNFSLQDLFGRRTISELAAHLSAKLQAVEAAVPEMPVPRSRLSMVAPRDRSRLPPDLEDAYPLTTLQAGLVFHSEMSPDTAIYHSVHSFHLRAALDVEALRSVLHRCAAAQPILRTSYSLGGFSEPLQMVHRTVDFPIEVEDISALTPGQQQIHLSEWLNAQKYLHFDYSKAPLLRFDVHRRSDETFQLTFSAHHSIFDGWSDSLFLTELFSAYLNIIKGQALGDGVPLAIPYGEFVALERHALGSSESKQFWVKKLEGSPSALLPRWPNHHTRGDKSEFREFPVTISSELSAQLRELARSLGVSLKTVLLAAHMRVISLVYGRPDVITGLVTNGRPEAPGAEKMMGLFVNTLPFRLRLEPWTSEELIRRIFEAEKEILPHRRYPLSQIQKDSGGGLLFESCFNFTHFHVYRDIQGVKGIEVLDSASVRETHFVLLANFYVSVPESEVGMEVSCNAAELSAEQLERIGGYYRRTLEAMVSHPSETLSLHQSLTEPEIHALLVEWNDTQAGEHHACIHDWFEARAAEDPKALAVADESDRLTYGDLNRKANQLARHLRKQGVKPGCPVALFANRSVEMIVGVLGTLKAGGAYVPLDPALPGRRLSFLLEDTRAQFVITETRLMGRLPDTDADIICIDPVGWEDVAGESDENLDAVVTPGDLAYVIYTSGSTGQPKGVMVQHASAVNLAAALHRSIYAKYGPGLRIALIAPLSFDASVKQILQLLYGHALFIVPDGVRLDGRALLSFLRKNGIDALDCTPSHLKLLLPAGLTKDPELAPSLVLVGGEPIDDTSWSVLASSVRPRFYNVYGPTECTVDATVHEIRPKMKTPVIGRPIPNVTMFVLDSQLCPAPLGVPGGLYVGGAGMARGYLNQPELTAERFVPNPFSERPGSRMYNTGDMARYLPDGNIEYRTRADGQIKLRGHRIELGEIEATLARHPAVREAAVALKQISLADQRLVAYIIPDSLPGPGSNELLAFLKARLPEYMLPGVFQNLDALSLTPNGKLDRAALPLPGQDLSQSQRAFQGPRTPIEEVVANIWTNVLGLEKVDVTANFFELGGHSILATQVIAWACDVFRIKMPLRLLFDSPTVEGLSTSVERALRSGAGSVVPSISPTNRGERLPLSFAQQRLWFLQQLDPEMWGYNIPLGFRITGRFVITAIEAATGEMVRRHQALRTTFAEDGAGPFQIVEEDRILDWELVDLKGIGDDKEAIINRLADEEARRSFDLRSDPPVRLKVIEVGCQENVLLFTVHHIATDGWSMGILTREAGELYEDFQSGRPGTLPELEIQYADFAVWQREWLQGRELQSQLAYWKQQLAGAPPILQLPWDWPRPRVNSHNGASQRLSIGREAVVSLRKLGSEEGATLFMALLAAFEALLCRYAGLEDIVVGMPIAGRTRREIESTVGFFVNNLPVRVRVSRDLNFRELLGRVREAALSGYAHQDLPFEKLVEELAPIRDPSYPPLVQVTFALHNAPTSHLALPGLAVQPVYAESRASKFDLAFSLSESGEGLIGLLEYNQDLFDPDTIRRLAEYYRTVLDGVSADPDSLVRNLPLLSEGWSRQLLYDWNETAAPYPSDRCIHELFDEQAALTPDSVAASYEDLRLSYRELGRRADMLAARLVRAGVEPGTPVALCVARSFDMLICVLAVLKAGRAYVPIDPSLPSGRIQALLDDVKPAAVLVADPAWPAPAGHRVLLAQAEYDRPVEDRGAPLVDRATPDNLAYIIYTSGSTGKPKGVMINHRSVVSYLYWFNRKFCDMVLPFVTELSFDASLKQMLAPLIRGGEVWIVDSSTVARPELLLAAIDRQMEAGLNCVPSLWAAAIESIESGDAPAAYRGPSNLFLGGEPLRCDLVDRTHRLMPGTRIWNLYGPTEATANATFASVNSGNRIGIGRPIANTRVYLLDPDLQPVPIGAVGELYAAGEGVGCGYLNCADLTAASFLPDSFAGSGDRLYKTGDLARYRPDGEVELVGRADRQVKVRGFRIELGEIESVLGQCPGVRESIVLAGAATDGDRMVAYVVGDRGHKPDTSQIRQFLKTKLPDYMVPAGFVLLDELPLMPNGKIDRRGLAVSAQAENAQEDPAYGVDAIEEMISGIWTELLGAGSIGVQDNFFEIGGHSLLATQLLSRLRRVFQVELPLRLLFEAPTVSEQALAIRTARWQGIKAPPLTRQVIPGINPPLSFAQQRLWLMDRIEPGVWVYNIPISIRLSGALNASALKASIGEIVRRHASLRTSFKTEGLEPVQSISPKSRLEWTSIYLGALSWPQKETLARQLAKEEGRKPFDLERGPLLRVKLLRLEEGEHLILFTMHHVIGDGWSMSVLMREVSALYEQFRNGRQSTLEELEIQYADFAVWQREWLQGEEMERQLEFWKQKLDGAPQVISLPQDRPQPAAPSYHVAIQSIRIPANLTLSLKALSRREGVTLFMTLFSAFATLLYRLSGQDDLCVGTAIANRKRVEIEELIGFFVNMLVLRADLSGNPTFRGLLSRIRETALDAYAHQDFPFDKLVEVLRPARSLKPTPLFHVVFALQNTPSRGAELAGLEASPLGVNVDVAPFDLTFSIAESGSELEGLLGYQTDLYDESTIDSMLEYFVAILHQVTADPDRQLIDLELQSARARPAGFARRLMEEFESETFRF